MNTMQRLAVCATMLAFSATTQATTNTVQSIPQQEVIEAALYGKIETIEQALTAGYKVDSRDPDGRTALMFAAFNGQTKIVQKLIDAGADVNAQDKIGATALMFASSGPFTETVQLLIDKGAKVNTADNNEHWTALMWAGAEGQADVVKILLKHNADATLKEVDGDTAESFAVKNGHTNVVAILQAISPKPLEPIKE